MLLRPTLLSVISMNESIGPYREMTMKEGKYYYAIIDRLCILKPVGNIIYTLSPDADVFLTKLFTDNTADDILFDMMDTEYIDSTNLGILARISKVHARPDERKYTIISTRRVINEILFNLNFDKIFTIITEPVLLDGKMEQLPRAEKRNADLAPILLKAHRFLMSMNDSNKSKFREVVEFLKEDMKKRAKKPAGPTG
jgi:anti-anti-sigma regulatory factor